MGDKNGHEKAKQRLIRFYLQKMSRCNVHGVAFEEQRAAVGEGARARRSVVRRTRGSC
jgi:hypothetical protein